jgi:hypothetical protein
MAGFSPGCAPPDGVAGRWAGMMVVSRTVFVVRPSLVNVLPFSEVS